MSTKSSYSSSTTSLPFKRYDFYRVMLLNTDIEEKTVLMYYSDGVWDLPYFEYPERNLDGTLIPLVCNDFKSWLGIISDEVYFTAAVELLGEIYFQSKMNSESIGRMQLLVVETHGIKPAEIHLPKSAEWKRRETVQNAFPRPELLPARVMVTKTVSCLEKPSIFLDSLSDERYRPGWFENASHFLVESVSRDGAQIDDRVIQSHMSSTSTMLRVKTSLGNYFLKSPASGCNETAITAVVAKLFPNVCPSIVGTSKELNCFVSREFDHKQPDDIRDAVLALGRLQLESIDHIESLVEAGCPVRDIEVVLECPRDWMQQLTDWGYITDDLVEALPVIEELSAELKTFKIPMTLVHGDVSVGNVGFAERDGCRDLIIFDWEYAYIGHPFFDFHRLHKRVPENVRDEYLDLWTSFEDIDRARRAYRIAKKLGSVMKLWSMFEFARKCNAQHRPVLASQVCELAAYSNQVLCPLPQEKMTTEKELL